MNKVIVSILNLEQVSDSTESDLFKSEANGKIYCVSFLNKNFVPIYGNLYCNKIRFDSSGSIEFHDVDLLEKFMMYVDIIKKIPTFTIKNNVLVWEPEDLYVVNTVLD